MTRSTITLIGMGGTIGFTEGAEGAAPTLAAGELAAAHDLPNHRIATVDLAAASSIALDAGKVMELARLISRAACEPTTAGVVVSHGTDTLEESIYLVALTCARPDVPVVFTAAMRHEGALGADGAANLRDALCAAATPALAGVGPVVAIDGAIHAARFVEKGHSTSLAAFSSPSAGAIGEIVEGRATLWFQPRYDDFIAALPTGALPRVEIVPMVMGASRHLLEAVIESAPAGIVVDGFGAGHVVPSLVPLLARARQGGIEVVVASRCAAGTTLRRTYAVPGTEIDLQRHGLVLAGSISALKARLRLAVAIGAGAATEAAFPVE